MNDLIEQKPLAEFTEKAYLDYSMYVILDRALPNVADGLKPVQRRIVYAMSELGLKATAKYKKSARTVGDVLGKFHPHGDTACYEAMVLMAQPFSYRYPLVDGQGNWGSTDDPKSFAAMRYTEAKLSPYAEILLAELQQGTVDWVDNFDATLQEPALLPARLPNVFLNGATGIAVGMSSDILPHNLTEIANACIHLLENPKASLEAVLNYIQGPDFPTSAEIITPIATIRDLYAVGYGTIRARAVYSLENHNIVITALPYQVSGAKIIEQIALQLQQKKLPMVEDVRDESDHEDPIRLVIVPRSNRIDVDSLMLHLFATTDLERTYRLNFNMIGLNGKPEVKNILVALREWLVFRISTVEKRLTHRLHKVQDRLHILEGLQIVFLNLDEVIKILHEEDEPKTILIKRFGLTDRQVDAILETKLRHLAKLEEMKLRAEQDALIKEQNHLMAILASEAKLRTLVKKEIIIDRDRFGDARRSPIVSRTESQALKEEHIVPNEAITVVLSQKGWIRAAKGHDINGEELSYKAGDAFKAQANARMNQQILFWDTEGKVYSLPGHVLPSARGQGEPLTGKLNPAEGMSFVELISGEPDTWILLANTAGYGFVTQCKDLYVKNRNGKACFKLSDAQLLPPRTILNLEQDLVACLSNTGRLLLFPIQDLPALARGKGNRLLSITTKKDEQEYLLNFQVLSPGDNLIIHVGKRRFTLKGADLQAFHGIRGRRGNRLPRGLQNVTALEVQRNDAAAS